MRMRSAVHGLKSSDRGVGVPLRRPQRRVAQQLLDSPEVCSRMQQVRSATVPESMGVQTGKSYCRPRSVYEAAR